jgi:hypothetical protein
MNHEPLQHHRPIRDRPLDDVRQLGEKGQAELCRGLEDAGLLQGTECAGTREAAADPDRLDQVGPVSTRRRTPSCGL